MNNFLKIHTHCHEGPDKQLLRIVFRENYGYSNEYQSVDIKVLLHQNIQCIKYNYNILAEAPDTQYVGYVYMTMSRTKITYNQFYNC